MSSISRGRGLAATMAGTAALAAVLAACTPPPSEGGGGEGGGGGEVAEGCEDYAPFIEMGDLQDTEVSVYTTITGDEATAQEASYEEYERCTGTDIVYEANDEFEAQIAVRIQSGSAPDIAYIPQPGLLQRLVKDFPDAILPASEEVAANVDEFFTEEWREYGTVDGTLYGSPLGANAKSFVWYSPSMFAEAGYEIPTTWDELIALSDRIVAEHPDTKPWCVGIASGDATGWPATDWLEDVVLRTAGPDVYDQWYTHEIPFDDPQVVEALDTAGEILRNPDYVNGGLGDVSSIATTAWDAGGFPILDGSCWMHRAANFYGVNWQQAQEGVEIAEDGDVFAFYLPGATADEKPMLGGGEFVVSFEERPEVQAFHAFLASDVWANDKAEVSNAGWVSANSGLDVELLQSPIDRLASEILASDEYTFRFDASDLMPGPVGAGSFWTGMTNWLSDPSTSSEQVLSDIEGSWPAS
ncbi:ABC transporter substrate-binding protein [Cellulomonas marina]|uniref:Alpha-glucoside transport system substrate-binding protein n=1 Tax=Cellulomonas marina TaxID=988821 RepID=A0A1I1AC26_9CELL|nr:ABC transporter substrate-binding protein [Cellulomonas marina]GIG30387.1 alpha-glucoside ABC transporter substrate-binding protein [Cellulomonas marina]SFB34926.1 alpha-glucoside transport system substrate-binding protein [Cellulomonas marina]